MLTLGRNIVFSVIFHALVAVSAFMTGWYIVGEKEHFIVVSFIEEALQSEKSVDRTVRAGGKDQHRQNRRRAEISRREKAEDASPSFDADMNNADMRSVGSMERVEDAEDTEKQDFAAQSSESTTKKRVQQTARTALSTRHPSTASYKGSTQKGSESRALTATGVENAGSEHASAFLSLPAALPVSGDPDPLHAIQQAIEKAKHYPYLAKKRGIEGTVVTEFAINSKGFPENIKVVRSSGFTILDTAAVNTVKKASPFPVIRDTLEIPITFTLTYDE